MGSTQQEQRTILKFGQDSFLQIAIDNFLTARKTEQVSQRTLEYYHDKLIKFFAFCQTQAISEVTQITPATIRAYLLHLEITGHNPGGCHAAFRALRAFLYWWENEFEPEGWSNPIRGKVKAPKVALEPLEPVSPQTVQALLACCKNDFTGKRDKALILFLLDSGTRAAECLAVNVEDVNQATGAVLIRRGKGRKPRTAFIGKVTRRALRAYLKQRADKAPALWVTQEGERLTYAGLRSMIQRRAKLAGVAAPEIHGFRRAFALTMLRNGVDLITLQRLMGHAGLTVLQRYLAQTETDLQQAHRRGSPVDNL